MSTLLRNEAFEKAYGLCQLLTNEVKKVISGKDEEIVLLIAALISEGHVLIEDVPGVGKTTLASALSRAAGLDFRRAQFTPDVMASDITGFNMYNRKTESFEFKEGLVNTNVLLADEINRASPKTQSSLLEAMEETKVTVDGVTYEIPKPFMVIATQNPSGYVGTFPLPEAQLDRFSLRISMGYPDTASELEIVRGRKRNNPMESVNAVCNTDRILFLQKAASEVTISEKAEEYIVELVRATRKRAELSLGASPRASIALMKLSRALALIRGRDYVEPKDIRDLFIPSVAHRVVLSREAKAKGATAGVVLGSIIDQTKVPFTDARK